MGRRRPVESADFTYPEVSWVPARWREPEPEGPQALILPMELNLNGKIARMFSTVTSVATPHDVTLQGLHVEVFYPADAETEARVLTALAVFFAARRTVRPTESFRVVQVSRLLVRLTAF
jgi:hypothetical protein